MKKIWTIISVLAVAHLLALGGFAGWLAGTGRLSGDRVESIRRLLASPAGKEGGEEALEVKPEAENGVRQAMFTGEGPSEGEPVPAEVVLSMKMAQSEVDRQRAELLKQQVEQIIATTLSRERDEFNKLVEKFKAEQEAFRLERERIAATEGSEQFKKTVETLSTMSPKAGKGVLKAMIEGDVVGGGEEGMTQAVSLINALDGTARTPIIEQFQKDDAELAAELLIRLRTYGQVARSVEDSADDPIGG